MTPGPDIQAGGNRPESGADASGAPRRREGRLRAWLALDLVVLAGLVALPAVVGLWSHQLLLDTDRYVATVGPLVKDPHVSDAVADFATEQIFRQLGLQRFLQDRLPPSLHPAASSAVKSAEGKVRIGLRKTLRTEAAHGLWIAANRRAHAELVMVLRGDAGYIRLHGDEVRLDLVPFIALGIEEVSRALPSSLQRYVRLPGMNPTAAPDRQRAQLEAAIGRPLPDGFAQIVVFRGAEARGARRTVRIFETLVWALVAGTSALIAAALVVSPRRRRTIIQLGLGAVAAVIVGRIAAALLEHAVDSRARSTSAAAVLRPVVHVLVASLWSFTVWLLVAGAAVSVLAFLAGRLAWLRRVFAR